MMLASRTPVTRSACRLLSYSRMLDLGGAPAMKNEKIITRVNNASKNCKIQAVCFDFDALTRNIDAPADNNNTMMKSNNTTTTKVELGKVEPNTSMIQQVANLLNVSLGGDKKMEKKRTDDLSLLLGKEDESNNKKQSSFSQDVREKYAAKLSKKAGIASLAGIELAKNQVDNVLQRGDAAGHLAARKRVAGTGNSGNRWLAQTGTGALLQYLTKRSIKISLLPKPHNNNDDDEEGDRMESLKKQLHDVVFDILLKNDDTEATAESLIQTVLDKLDHVNTPELVLIVSDRDDYLRAAKDAGMVTCRIRPANTRRGNVSSHYSIPSMPEVMNVVNEINGISFNAILSRV